MRKKEDGRMEDHKEFRLLRRTADVSQYDVAVETGGTVSQGEISLYERGLRKLNETKLQALQEALDLCGGLKT